MREQEECVELCLQMGGIVVGVCYRQLDQEQKDEAKASGNFRQLEEASYLQTLVLMVGFNCCIIYWRGNTSGCKQSRRFLECTDDNFLTQVIEKVGY